jgi:hypothetical protein
MSGGGPGRGLHGRFVWPWRRLEGHRRALSSINMRYRMLERLLCSKPQEGGRSAAGIVRTRWNRPDLPGLLAQP